jgi:hypothetical protein
VWLRNWYEACEILISHGAGVGVHANTLLLCCHQSHLKEDQRSIGIVPSISCILSRIQPLFKLNNYKTHRIHENENNKLSYTVSAAKQQE